MNSDTSLLLKRPPLEANGLFKDTGASIKEEISSRRLPPVSSTTIVIIIIIIIIMLLLSCKLLLPSALLLLLGVGSPAAVSAADSDPVAVALYMESLCPDCQEFFIKQFFPTWQKLNATGILTVDAIPYGNAREAQQDNKWIFTCQHGGDECVGNQFETCAINLLVTPQKWMPYLHCMEQKLQSGGQDVTQVAKDCAGQLNISFDALSQCALSSQGNAWEHAMAQRTDALNPPHNYVPWITVNGVHTEKIQQEAEENLLKLVCTTYTGVKPKECAQFGAAVGQRCNRN